MRIGVFLGGYTPDSGGGYTFQSDLFNAFLRQAKDARHDFAVLCDTLAIAQDARSLTRPRNVEIVPVGKMGLMERAVGAMKRELPIARRFLRGPERIERAASRAGVDLVWFIGGAYDPIDIPYVAMVWDLQHRSHPWFPEVSVGGTWDARERLTRPFLQRATYVIVGTDVGTEEAKLFYGIPPGRIRKLPHPTPSFVFDALSQGNEMPSGTPPIERGYLLYPAQFWPHKNHVNLLLALKKLRDDHGMRPRLVLVGSDKGNREYVKRLVDTLGLASQVYCLGFVRQEELIALYRNAGALVYTSFCGPENLPPLEAFAFGCPVVAADIPGAREQLGDAAELVDPGSPESISEGIYTILSNSSLRQSLIQKGLVRAKSWVATDFVRNIFTVFDEFEPIRRSWVQTAAIAKQESDSKVQ
jgi:glycosyltransferase involved in cell wall biosynthesis